MFSQHLLQSGLHLKTTFTSKALVEVVISVLLLSSLTLLLLLLLLPDTTLLLTQQIPLVANNHNRPNTYMQNAAWSDLNFSAFSMKSNYLHNNNNNTLFPKTMQSEWN